MSHNATNWAIQQRGLKPATKIVLWHLCDRHNPDLGCFPSQDNLATDCEMSRSSLNDHLKILEEKGLIRRQQRVDKETKKHLPTRYYFTFEAEFHSALPKGEAQDVVEPCPENGHGAVSENHPEPCPENGESRVRNSDTNPVREPVREPVSAAPRTRDDLDELQDKLLDAVGDGNIQPHGALDLSAILGLLSSGVDLDTDILPTIRARAVRLRRPAGSWAYFTEAIRDAYSRRIEAGQGLLRPKPSLIRRDQDLTDGERRERWIKALDYVRGTGIWLTWMHGPPPGQEGCRVPADLLEPRDLSRNWFEQKAREAA